MIILNIVQLISFNIETKNNPKIKDYHILNKDCSFACNKFTCQFCGFTSDKKAGLSAHERGCKAKKENNN